MVGNLTEKILDFSNLSADESLHKHRICLNTIASLLKTSHLSSFEIQQKMGTMHVQVRMVCRFPTTGGEGGGGVGLGLGFSSAGFFCSTLPCPPLPPYPPLPPNPPLPPFPAPPFPAPPFPPAATTTFWATYMRSSKA